MLRTYRTFNQIAVDISKHGSVGAFYEITIPLPRRRETSTVCLSVCLSFPPPVTNIFVLFFSGITDVRHLIFGVQPRLVVPPHAYYTLVQYSPLNRFPTFKKKISLNIGNGFKLWSILGYTGPSRFFPTEFTQESPEKLRLFSEQKN